MKILKIKFETITLAWNIAQDPVAQKWATSLLSLSTMHPDKVQYTNFEEDELTKTYKKLDENIKKFHHIANSIPELPETINQDYLNLLHEWFAVNESVPNTLFRNIHSDLHSIEGMIKGVSSPRIEIGYYNSIQNEFEESDYFNFSKIRNFGDIELTYHHIGKDTSALYYSQDTPSENNFVPYTTYSANFFVWFVENSPLGQDENFWKWFDNNYEWFKNRTGWERRDARIAAGRYKVADLILTQSKDEILNSLNKCPTILEITIG